MVSLRCYLSRSEPSDHLTREGLKIATNTLAKLAVSGGGPPFVKFLSRALYDPEDLDRGANHRIDVDEEKDRSDAMIVAPSAIGADTEIGRATP